MKNSITQITEDFIKKIGEIFKESEKLYETEGLPSPNAIGTLQTNGNVTLPLIHYWHSQKKFSHKNLT